MKIQDLYPYTNIVMLEKAHRLRWDIKAIITALNYIEDKTKKECTHHDLIDGICKNNPIALTAVLFGAMYSAEGIKISTFEKLKKPLGKCAVQIYEGILRYMPEAGIEDDGEDLDERWPDTQKQIKQTAANDNTWRWIQTARKELKISMSDIERLSLRNIVTMYELELEEHGYVQYNGEDDI